MFSLCGPSGTETHLYVFTEAMGEEQALLAFWSSGTTISSCVHLSVHTQNFWHGMDDKIKLELLWKTESPGRAVSLI